MDINPKVQDEYMIPIENLMNPRALDFHAQSNFIYFSDATSYLIGRQKIDGTERDTILKEGTSVAHLIEEAETYTKLGIITKCEQRQKRKKEEKKD